MTRRLIAIAALGAVAGLFIIPLNPVNSRLLNIALLLCLAGAWLGIVFFAWRWKAPRIGALVLPVLWGIPFVLPGAAINRDELRRDYVKRMMEREGTTYVWGGESPRGIDCSGLPRRALRDALLSYGVRHGSGRAFRAAAENWWFDASAKALGDGYRQYTVPAGIDGTIREMDYENLVPGDLAVTASGIHVLAYAGEGRWIQADPEIGAVATLEGRNSENVWFTEPVRIFRWKILESDR